jgi:hypothetical protein
MQCSSQVHGWGGEKFDTEKVHYKTDKTMYEKIIIVP